MMDNYSDRKIGRYESEGCLVSTCRVTDGRQPYETAVEHEDYGDTMVIVEAYDTRSGAKRGHRRWVKTMQENPPAKLVDCQNAWISQLIGGLEVERNDVD